MASKKNNEQTSALMCATCGEPIGDKTLPVNHAGAVYCPQCFVHVVTLDTGHIGLHAAKCGRCEAVFVAHGPRCPQCRYTVLTALPKK